MKPTFLISNDDGVLAKGINYLYNNIQDICNPIIYAPLYEQSACSQTLTVRRPLRIKKVNENIYSIDGTPADSVMIGLYELKEKNIEPDWVIAGINRGSNLGTDTLYSGTVGAAIEGCLYGYKSIAISLDGYDEPLYYETCVYVLKKLFKNFLNTDSFKNIVSSLGDKGRFVLNINVPNVDISKIKGIKIGSIGLKRYPEAITKSLDPRGYPFVWIGGKDTIYENIPNSDQEAVDNGYVAVSIIKPNLNDKDSNKLLESCMGSSVLN